MKTIVVTGATGNIGRKLTTKLLKAGHSVRAITRSKENAKELLDAGAEILVGEMDDVSFLTSAFSGADSVFALIPPEYGAKSFRGRQNIIGDAIAKAIVASKVKHVVNLSSLGAEHSEDVGPIKGLHDQEQRLNKIEGLNLIHLRAAYFFENTLFGAQLVKSQNIFGTAVQPNVKFPQVATIDIAELAMRLLVDTSFRGRKIVEVISESETTMERNAKIISDVLGKTIPYIAFSYDATRNALVESGLSEDVANQFVELYDAMNKGLIHSNGHREQSKSNIGFLDFMKEVRSYFQT